MKKRHIQDPLAEARRLEQEKLERQRQEMIMAQNDVSARSLKSHKGEVEMKPGINNYAIRVE